MIILLVAAVLLLTAVAGAIRFARRRSTAVALYEPRPEPYRNIRVLRKADEVRDAARRAYEHETSVARAAARRAARFRELA
jgi:uncharacterized membrane protein